MTDPTLDPTRATGAAPAGFGRRLTRQVVSWFDSHHVDHTPREGGPKVEWLRILPFLAMHLGCALVIWVGWSPFAVGVAVALYALRMFAITGFYHRYFSHRAFRTSRAVQFLGALLGNSSGQRGPLWWAAHHREHHRKSDQEGDVHSPVLNSFLWSHMLWFTTRENHITHEGRVRDLARFPELRWLDRFDSVVPLALGALLFLTGVVLEHVAPGLGTNGPQLFIWGFCISTTVLAHATFTINSLAHRWGHRPYETSDDSRNNAFLALITLGEGWHNNHHHYSHSVRQGFRWWEIDLTYMTLKVLERVGLVWDLAPVPERVQHERRTRTPT